MAEHQYCGGLSRLLGHIGNFLAPFLLLFLRLFFGVLFLFAGLEKFSDIGKVIEFFGQLNIPAPLFFAYLVAFVETVGGLFLAIGFISRYASLFLLVTMAVAIVLTELHPLLSILVDPKAFLQESHALPFFLAAATVFCFGPGCLSVDALFEKFCCKDHCSR